MKVVAALEAVRDITVASHLVGDMTGSTIDDPLSGCYKKLGCTISPLDKESADYKMILSYLEKTYEPVSHGDVVSASLHKSTITASNHGNSYADRLLIPQLR